MRIGMTDRVARTSHLASVLTDGRRNDGGWMDEAAGKIIHVDAGSSTQIPTQILRYVLRATRHAAAMQL